MHSQQNAFNIAKDQMQQGNWTVAEANVRIIQMMGAKIVEKMPTDVRKVLNDAVKDGKLGHIKKEQLRPEVYHHINARPYALDLRERFFREKIEVMTKAGKAIIDQTI